ncbi:MAG TPA: PAS domain-containing sensor histidine kinase [Acidimicrobiia bacterium]
MGPKPTADLSRLGGQSTACPECSVEVEVATFPADDPLNRESWEQLHSRYHALRHEADHLRADLDEARIGSASFESLFRISPFPVMEQDYTRVEAWMDELRGRGVTDIRQALPDIESVRGVVPLIWIVSANPAACLAVGVTIEELIGPVDPRIVNEESYPSWISQLQAVWNREPEAHAAFTAETPSGETYDAESTLAAPVVYGEPDFSRAMFTVVDVTGHRREGRRIEELIETKNRFLATISHEIRTPLTAIVGFSQMLEADEQMSHEDRMLMVSSIVEQSREVSHLVNDLLIAARAEGGEVSVEAKRIDVADQIEQTIAAGGSFTVGVQFVRPRQPVVATADPARVRQILRNLLTNAERYGGPNVSVSISLVDGWVAVDVVDDGPGLPHEEWEAIFQLYHRAHLDSKHESVGIGLAVSRQLAELMGGSLEYFGEDDRSVFHLKLPDGSFSA